MRKVLLLNASEEVLRFIGCKKQFLLLFSGKAEEPYNYEEYYDVTHSSGVFFY